MSSAAGHSPESSRSSAETQEERALLKAPPTRPALVSPPKRPVKPVTKVVKEPPSPPPKPMGNVPPPVTEPDTTLSHYLPISPPSEPMQYRAIGLIRGVYIPEEESFNRGRLETEDGTAIDTVLLGRITSLVKKHLDLATSHLWVVYPRTRRVEEDSDWEDLSVQIVGVWEPETLGLPGEDGEAKSSGAQTDKTEAPASSTKVEVTDTSEESAASEKSAEPENSADIEKSKDTTAPLSEEKPATVPKISLKDLPPVNENYFSIRGEILKAEDGDETIFVKILQGVKRPSPSLKAFRLLIKGSLTGRTVGYFWDLEVKREGKILVLEKGSPVGIVPPKKRKGGGGRPPRRGSRPFPARHANSSPSPSPIPRSRHSGDREGASEVNRNNLS